MHFADAPQGPDGAPSALKRFVVALPRGRSLPTEVWERRHRWMTLLVWSQALMLTA